MDAKRWKEVSAACQTVEAAKLSRLHNDANVLCLGARGAEHDATAELVDVWLTSEFEGGRHARRVGKIMALEQGGTC